MLLKHGSRTSTVIHKYKTILKKAGHPLNIPTCDAYLVIYLFLMYP